MRAYLDADRPVSSERDGGARGLRAPGRARSSRIPFGEQAAVYKVAGKIFAIVGLERTPPQITLKCDPEHGELLRARARRDHPGLPHEQAPLDHGRRSTAASPPTLIEELIEDSFDLVAPRNVRR